MTKLKSAAVVRVLLLAEVVTLFADLFAIAN
jgi:hypothetical protein